MTDAGAFGRSTHGEVKHKEKGGYNFTNNELPIHLAKELSIITAMIDKAATELALRHCKRFLIDSDHVASQLAVLRRKEEKHDTDTFGEHSGRCCKRFCPYGLPFAAKENGYLVLADYGRFKGSRVANVEVHGGASLEEVVVPIIELTLKNGRVTVKLVNENVTVDFRIGMGITLFFNSPVQSVSVVLNGKLYISVQIDGNHYIVKLPDIKRAGDYFTLNSCQAISLSARSHSYLEALSRKHSTFSHPFKYPGSLFSALTVNAGMSFPLVLLSRLSCRILRSRYGVPTR